MCTQIVILPFISPSLNAPAPLNECGGLLNTGKTPQTNARACEQSKEYTQVHIIWLSQPDEYTLNFDLCKIHIEAIYLFVKMKRTRAQAYKSLI